MFMKRKGYYEWWHLSSFKYPIEMLFAASPMEFEGLYNDIIFWCEMIVLGIIKEIAIVNLMQLYYST